MSKGWLRFLFWTNVVFGAMNFMSAMSGSVFAALVCGLNVYSVYLLKDHA